MLAAAERQHNLCTLQTAALANFHHHHQQRQQQQQLKKQQQQQQQQLPNQPLNHNNPCNFDSITSPQVPPIGQPPLGLIAGVGNNGFLLAAAAYRQFMFSSPSQNLHLSQLMSSVISKEASSCKK